MTFSLGLLTGLLLAIPLWAAFRVAVWWAYRSMCNYGRW